MREDTPSQMAQSVAMVRAAHQLLDHPLVLEDRLAMAILGKEAGEQLAAAPEKFETPGSRHIRAFMTARSRYAEDELAHAIGRGATQYVLLGAGLDTFVYRHADAHSTLRVFEVDHPVTQRWKRERLASAGIPIPSAAVFVSVDLERSALISALDEVGFDRHRITFFSWLGLTPYLRPDIVASTLALIASLPRGSGVVFDYAVEGSSLGPVERIAQKVLMRRVARAGEPFQTFFEPGALAAILAAAGFTDVEDLGPLEIDERYFRDRADGLSVSAGLARLVRARV